MKTTYYAAIDVGGEQRGAVYGLGDTPTTAVDDAYHAARDGRYEAATCTAAAADYLREHGGAPSAKVCVDVRHHCAGHAGEPLPVVHLGSECGRCGRE